MPKKNQKALAARAAAVIEAALAFDRKWLEGRTLTSESVWDSACDVVHAARRYRRAAARSAPKPKRKRSPRRAGGRGR